MDGSNLNDNVAALLIASYSADNQHQPGMTHNFEKTLRQLKHTTKKLHRIMEHDNAEEICTSSPKQPCP